MYYTYSKSQHDYIVVSDKQLHWAQLHVLALGVGHHQVVLRIIEQLYNKQVYGGSRGWWETSPTTPQSPQYTLLIL